MRNVRRSSKIPTNGYKLISVLLPLGLYVVTAYVIFTLYKGNVIPHSVYIAMLLLITSFFFYVLIRRLVQIMGGIDSKSEETNAYGILAMIAVVLFAAISQLHTGVIVSIDALALAAMLTISVGCRLASHLRKLSKAWQATQRDISWIFLIYVILTGVYILLFLPA